MPNCPRRSDRTFAGRRSSTLNSLAGDICQECASPPQKASDARLKPLGVDDVKGVHRRPDESLECEPTRRRLSPALKGAHRRAVEVVRRRLVLRAAPRRCNDVRLGHVVPNGRHRKLYLLAPRFFFAGKASFARVSNVKPRPLPFVRERAGCLGGDLGLLNGLAMLRRCDSQLLLGKLLFGVLFATSSALLRRSACQIASGAATKTPPVRSPRRSPRGALRPTCEFAHASEGGPALTGS